MMIVRRLSFNRPGRELFITGFQGRVQRKQLEEVVKGEFRLMGREKFAFALFPSPEAALEALQLLNAHTADGYTLRARLASPRFPTKHKDSSDNETS